MTTPSTPPPGGFGAPGPAGPLPPYGPQYGVPGPPLPPYGPGAVSRPSAGLKVLAVIQIIFGVLGLLMTPVSALMANLQLSKDPLQQKLHDLLWTGPAAVWSYSSLLFGMAGAMLLVATGIGIWRSKRWARKTGLIYGGASLALLVLGQVFMFAIVYPMLMDQLDAASNPVVRAGAMGGLVGGLIGGLFGGILPLATVIVLTRASVKEQLVD